jgi:hypothetical protein
MKRASTAQSMFVPVIVAATPEDEVAHKLGVKVWFQDHCTVKKTGLSAMMKSAKPKTIYILPGKIAIISGDIDGSLRIQAALTTDKTFEIDGNLRESVAKKEVTLEFQEHGQPKPTKETIVFDTDQAAAQFMTVLREERSRSYIHSENFTPKFMEDLNSAIRMKIQAGDEPLRQMFLACCNQASPSTAVEALFTNYRTMMDFEESAVSFADLLSAVAQDPIVYILFLCCAIDAGKSMYEHFQAIKDREIDNSAELFQLLLSHITHTVSKPEWKLKRELLLSQFQYPASAAATGVAGECRTVLHFALKDGVCIVRFIISHACTSFPSPEQILFVCVADIFQWRILLYSCLQCVLFTLSHRGLSALDPIGTDLLLVFHRFLSSPQASPRTRPSPGPRASRTTTTSSAWTSTRSTGCWWTKSTCASSASTITRRKGECDFLLCMVFSLSLPLSCGKSEHHFAVRTFVSLATQQSARVSHDRPTFV